MTAQRTEYIVITSTDLDEFIKLVQDKLDDGWDLHENLQVTNAGRREGIMKSMIQYTREMVKWVDSEEIV